MSLKITIITPTFNSEKDIESCILSVANQNYENKEHIIIDGLSTDKTIEIVKKYSKIYSHIIFVSEKDDGIYDAMNKGIGLARGDWLYFLGSDDVLCGSNVFERVLLESDDCEKFDFLYGDVLWGDTGKVYDGKFSQFKMFNHNICHQAIFFRKELFEKYGKFDTEYKLLADWIYNMKMFSIDDVRKKYINITIAKYAITGVSSLNNIDSLFEKNILKLLSEYFPLEFEYMKSRDAEYEKIFLEKNQEIEQREKLINEKDLEVELMKGSKFWKLRNFYIKYKL